jgi:DNA-binding response OmpR family regulator
MNVKNLSKAGWETSVAFQKINSSHRILVAEDDADTRRLNTEVLMGSGYKVDVAEDGAVAWEILQLKKYHLLITGHKMPNMSGIELIKNARAARMALPVIMLSGMMPVEKLEDHSRLQIDAILPKPYDIADLLKTVKKVLGAPVSVSENA